MKKWFKILAISFAFILIVPGVVLLTSCGKSGESKIELEKSFKTTYYVGEEIDLTGGVIKFISDNNTESKIVITIDMISGFTTEYPGTRNLTITYNEKHLELKYEVKEIPELQINYDKVYKTTTSWAVEGKYLYIEFIDDENVILTNDEIDKNAVYSKEFIDESWILKVKESKETSDVILTIKNIVNDGFDIIDSEGHSATLKEYVIPQIKKGIYRKENFSVAGDSVDIDFSGEKIKGIYTDNEGKVQEIYFESLVLEEKNDNYIYTLNARIESEEVEPYLRICTINESSFTATIIGGPVGNMFTFNFVPCIKEDMVYKTTTSWAVEGKYLYVEFIDDENVILTYDGTDKNAVYSKEFIDGSWILKVKESKESPNVALTIKNIVNDGFDIIDSEGHSATLKEYVIPQIKKSIYRKENFSVAGDSVDIDFSGEKIKAVYSDGKGQREEVVFENLVLEEKNDSYMYALNVKIESGKIVPFILIYAIDENSFTANVMIGPEDNIATFNFIG